MIDKHKTPADQHKALWSAIGFGFNYLFQEIIYADEPDSVVLADLVDKVLDYKVLFIYNHSLHS